MSKINQEILGWMASKFQTIGDEDCEFTSELLPMITMGFHDEVSNLGTNDVDVCIKQLTGQPIGNQFDYPFEMMIQVRDKYSDLFFEILSDFVKKYNRTTILNKYRFFANLPTIPVKTQSKGLYDYNTINMTIDVLSYTNVLGVKSVKINNTNIDFLNLAIVYAASTNSTGGLTTSQIKSVADTCATNFSMQYVSNNDTLSKNIIKQMINGTTANTSYTLALELDETLTINCIIKDAQVAQEINGYAIIQLTLTRGW